MQLTLWYSCPPAPESPGADDDDGRHYEELPVSVPPHVPQGLCLDVWEEGAYAEALEQLPVPPPSDHPDGDGAGIAETGGGAGAAGQWLRAAFVSVCRMVLMSVTLCGHL